MKALTAESVAEFLERIFAKCEDDSWCWTRLTNCLRSELPRILKKFGKDQGMSDKEVQQFFADATDMIANYKDEIYNEFDEEEHPAIRAKLAKEFVDKFAVAV